MTTKTAAQQRKRIAKPKTKARGQRRPAGRGVCARPSRYWLDIGKNISLMLMAEKYDLDVADDAGGDGER